MHGQTKTLAGRQTGRQTDKPTGKQRQRASRATKQNKQPPPLLDLHVYNVRLKTVKRATEDITTEA